jgi:hypothetical protein
MFRAVFAAIRDMLSACEPRGKAPGGAGRDLRRAKA